MDTVAVEPERDDEQEPRSMAGVTPRDRYRRLAWRSVAVLALAFGAIGLLLPVIPTVPFVILAAWAAERGWPELEQWLLRHARFGPHIHAWRARRAIPRRAKWLATAMMSGSAVIVAFTPIPLVVQAVVWSCLALVAAWLWTRPE